MTSTQSKGILLRNYFMRFGVTLIERAVGLIIVPVLVAEVGLAGVGYYGLSSSLILVFVNILCLRFPMAMIRFLPAERANAGSVLAVGLLFWLGLAAASAVALAVAPESLSLLAFADSSKLLLLVLAVTVGLLSTLYEFVSVTLRAENKFSLLSLLDVGERVLFLAGCILAFHLGRRTIEAVMIVLATTSAVRVVAVLPSALKHVGWRNLQLHQWTAMFAFSLPFLPHLASVWLIERSPFFFVAQQLDDRATGLLTISFAFAAVLNAVVLPIQATLYPMLSRAHDHGHHEVVRDLLLVGVRIALVVGAFGTITFTLGTPSFLRLLHIDEAAPPLALLLMMTLAFTASAIRQVIINVLHVKHDTRALLWISPLGGAAALVASGPLIASFGISGAAAGMLVGVLVQTAGMAARAGDTKRLVPSPSFLWSLAAAMTSAVLIQWFATTLSDVAYLAGCVLSGVAYVALLFFGGALTHEERQAVWRKNR